METLTDREVSVLKCLAEGHELEDVADVLCKSRSTIDKTLKSAKRKLQASTTANAVYKAIKIGLFSLLIASWVPHNPGMAVRNMSRTARNGRELLI